MHFRVYFKVKGTELGYFFWAAKISNIFLVCLIFRIFFWVNCRPWVRVYICQKNKSTPPGGGTTTFWQRELWDSCLQNPSESFVLFT